MVSYMNMYMCIQHDLTLDMVNPYVNLCVVIAIERLSKAFYVRSKSPVTARTFASAWAESSC